MGHGAAAPLIRPARRFGVPPAARAASLAGVRLALCTDTYAPQVNGVAGTLARLVAAVRDRGGVVRVFTTSAAGASADPGVTRLGGVPFPGYPELRMAWPWAPALRAAVEAFAPTLVHAATEFGIGLAGRRVAQQLGIPLVTSYHTNFTAYARHYRLGALEASGWRYLRWFHGAALRTYCPTDAVAAALAARGFRRCAVWSRGVDGARFAPHYWCASWRAAVGATPTTMVVTTVGRIAAEKGLEVAAEAMRRAMAARPGRLRWVVVGDGPWWEVLRARAPQGTLLTGRLEGEALSTAYASSDLFLFPSATDTFGNVMLEAMASGVPVLGADVGPTREQLSPDRGWLAAPGDAVAFADQLVRLVDAPEVRRGAAERALAHAAACTWEAVWDRLFADYAGLHRMSVGGAPG